MVAWTALSDEGRASAARRLKEAQNLAISVELLAFCDVQRPFVDADTGKDELHRLARLLAREARRRRLEPQTVLLAMRIAGCYRGVDVYPSTPERHTRYVVALRFVLAAFYGSESLPSERRDTPRKGTRR